MVLSTPPSAVTKSSQSSAHGDEQRSAIDIAAAPNERALRHSRQQERIGQPKVVRVADDGEVPRFRPGSAAVELETVVVTPKQVAVAMRSLPRTSAAAVGSLMIGLTAAFAVCTGTFVRPGIGLAAIAIIAGMAGEAATDRRRVVGKGIARLGMTLGVCSLILGLLVMTGVVPWGADANALESARDWLQTRLPWLFPGR